MIAFIDSGTTNSRVFIVKDGTIVSQGVRKVGVRDTAITGNKNKLRDGIRDAVLEAVESAGITVGDIKCCIASGMITSELGLVEVPHLVAPVGKSDLASSAVVVRDLDVFPFDIPVVFIRGIKNPQHGQNKRIADLPYIDFMRGEETQVVGILERYQPDLPLNVIVVGSHFKLIHVNSDGKIAGSMTTISGQFYEALVKETFIGKCIVPEDHPPSDLASGDVTKVAFDVVGSDGLLRAMLMPRFMQVLMSTTAEQRREFINAAIAAEDIRTFAGAEECGFSLATNYYLFGNEQMSRMYDRLIAERIGSEYRRTLLCDKNDIRDVTIQGAIAIAESSCAAKEYLQ